MTEALSGILPILFSRLKMHRVEAACLPENKASQALLHKIGFRREGFAKHYLKINGEWKDHLLFGLLETDDKLPPIPSAQTVKRKRARKAKAKSFGTSPSAARSQEI